MNGDRDAEHEHPQVTRTSVSDAPGACACACRGLGGTASGTAPVDAYHSKSLSLAYWSSMLLMMGTIQTFDQGRVFTGVYALPVVVSLEQCD